MTTEIEGGLRETLHQLADVTAPERLAAAALGQTRRRRRNRRMTGLGAVVTAALAVTAVVAVPSVLDRSHHLIERSGSGPSGRYVVSSYCSVNALEPPTVRARVGQRADATQCHVLDPRTGRYVGVDVGVTFSPDGAHALVFGSADRQEYGVVSRDRLLTEGHTAIRWLPVRVDDYNVVRGDWSPDGRTLLFSVNPRYSRPQKGTGSILLVDAATGTVTTREVRDPSYSLPLHPVWDPSGNSLWLPTNDRSPSLVNVDLALRRTGRVLGPSIVDGLNVQMSLARFSPDGRYLTGGGAPDVAIEVRTGRVLAARPGPHAGYASGVGNDWYDTEHFIKTFGGDSLEVVDLSGEVVHTLRKPDHGAISLSRAAGYPKGVGLRF